MPSNSVSWYGASCTPRQQSQLSRFSGLFSVLPPPSLFSHVPCEVLAEGARTFANSITSRQFCSLEVTPVWLASQPGFCLQPACTVSALLECNGIESAVVCSVARATPSMIPLSSSLSRVFTSCAPVVSWSAFFFPFNRHLTPDPRSRLNK